MFLQDVGVSTTNDNKEVANKSDVLILAVKPNIVPIILKELNPHISKDKLVISIAAGVTLASIEKVSSRYLL